MGTRQADPYGRGSYCIVVALHGTDSLEARTLRRFRDRWLRGVPGGALLINGYYRICPRLVAGLERHPVMRQGVAWSITGFSRILAGLRV